MERAPGMSVPQAINRASKRAVTSARASASVASVVSTTSAVSAMGRANVGRQQRLGKVVKDGGGSWRMVEGAPRPCLPPLTFTVLHQPRSEEHTSELQSRGHLVCR